MHQILSFFADFPSFPPSMPRISAASLRESIVQSLQRQGYRVDNGVISFDSSPSKDDLRIVNEIAVKKRLHTFGPHLARHEDRLLSKYIANGSEVSPRNIQPRVFQVLPNTEHELLFRYACLHWSIPVSSGYGRRLRFVVIDEYNGKLIGLFGLGDPVFGMKARDEWIGWDHTARAERLYHVLDAFVLGAVPPYSFLLCGKLIAMLICCDEVRQVFQQKYKGAVSLIRKEVRPPYLALVTTTSALGRSSIYNRIRVNGTSYWTSLGYTKGWGEFHFSNGVYDDMRYYVQRYCEPTEKHSDWGDGFRSKREVIRKCLAKIGLSSKLSFHGIQREIFAAPLGHNALRFLRGEVKRPGFFHWPACDLSNIFMDRWLLPRSERMPEFKQFEREQYHLNLSSLASGKAE